MTLHRLPRRPLGGTGLEVAPLGLASLSMRFRRGATPGLTPDDVEAAFHELGVNAFLVHPMMPAITEGVRRLIRSGLRSDLVLVSEVGVPFAGSVRRGLRRLLRSLGTDYLDVWLLGWVRQRWYLRPVVWRELRRLRSAGAVRAVGFSSHDRPLAAELADDLRPDVVMIRYNAAHRGAEREVFPALESDGGRRIGVIAYTATRWGMLLDPVPEQGFDHGMTGGECYQFALSHPAVDMVWCAARSADELREDVAAVCEGPLFDDRMDEVRRFGDAVHAAARGGRRWMFGATAH